ncbi:MAG TPA: c-type cytochrome [Burkholderiales bacterium]|nr:c-type cytochrome [Burkholderiales bacterium]
MDTHDQHSSFIKTPQQLAVVVVLAFLVPIVGIVLIIQLVVGRPAADPNAMTPEAVAARIAPVGRVEFGAPGAAAEQPAPKPQVAAAGKPQAVDGKAVYTQTCVACHMQSVAGSPPLGDKAAWAPRIKTGLDALVQSVMKGKGAMPPKGGNPALSDAQIRAAVEFMVSQSK